MASTFSSVTRKLDELSSKMSTATAIAFGRPGGGRAASGPLGPVTLSPKIRRQLDEGFGVPPSQGDPGYVPPPEPPVIPPPTPMPDPDLSSLGSIAARRRSIQAQLARRGRMSTILSQGQPEPLGG